MQCQTYDGERKMDQVGDMKVKLDLICFVRTRELKVIRPYFDS